MISPGREKIKSKGRNMHRILEAEILDNFRVDQRLDCGRVLLSLIEEAIVRPTDKCNTLQNLKHLS